MRHTSHVFGRRGLLRCGAAVAGSAALPFTFTYHRVAKAAGYGELVPDPEGIIDLPPGFSYKVLTRLFDPMSDGYRSPGLPDAMGAFPGPDDTIVLMRNHELGVLDILHTPLHPEQQAPPESYNPGTSGGVTRLVIDNATLELKSSNLVLFGTLRNCAGGKSPWGWLSCEETTDGKHGYTFLCDVEADRVQMPRQIAGYGRFKHEAACVDPDTLVAYLTEDQGDSCLYRFVPTDKADPFTGKLQALRAVEVDEFATTDMEVGQVVAVSWVDVDDPTPTDDSVRGQAQAKGAAIVKRGEGIWYWKGAVYVCSTNGGPAGAGQIFKLVDGPDGGTLELLARSEHPDILDHPDNITMAPWGELFMAEDGDGDNYVRVLNQAGEVFDFARNAKSDSEFSGVCFSPDGKTMFVNIMFDHLTLAIRGPFPDFVPEPETTGDESDTGAGTESGGSSDSGVAPTTGGGAGTAAPSTTDASSSTTDAATGGVLDDDGGCGCKADAGAPGLELVVAAAGALALRGRRGDAEPGSQG
ncbi:alkaline phosphatase PhoX [Nannocystis radixulma]|uniref:DUF839 domain-containing protein n=1 Tax=Nannocystis radixulma TaxID=2995305 RepID=A0ABT5BH41_9BACT|nr:alkaline phosphatase PhoX [Nannocystis radixulma]MDC0673407.1 DUF839 domain-containing protein [Nannocystis radixulma]